MILLQFSQFFFLEMYLFMHFNVFGEVCQMVHYRPNESCISFWKLRTLSIICYMHFLEFPRQWQSFPSPTSRKEKYKNRSRFSPSSNQSTEQHRGWSRRREWDDSSLQLTVREFQRRYIYPRWEGRHLIQLEARAWRARGRPHIEGTTSTSLLRIMFHQTGKFNNDVIQFLQVNSLHYM